MKNQWLVAMLVLIILSLAGCGDGGRQEPQLFSTGILSDPQFDGDIERDPTGILTITQGNTQSVFAGIHPVTGSEFRAFLDFPLDSVPVNAVIESATLDIFIDSMLPQSSAGIPILIDLVSFEPPVLLGTDFSRPFLVTTAINPPISSADLLQHVVVDVTPLMREAQRLGLSDFQVRIRQGTSGNQGLIEINDTTGIDQADFAPLLQVTYF